MQILYEDNDIIVIEKEPGIPVQTGSIATKDIVNILKNHIKNTCPGKDPYLGVIHRLDTPVRGILVFALNKEAAAKLSAQLNTGIFNKRYEAAVEGRVLSIGRVTLEDYLVKDRDNKAKIAEKGVKGAKKAILTYEVKDVDETNNVSYLDIELVTGRFHQIRAQLANAGHPVTGDKKYGATGPAGNGKGIGLTATGLSFDHPKTGKRMEFNIDDRNCKGRINSI
ncbi:MAG: RluA family pseudouridine synthase [Lachnospiraceae bacterium]|nr:RluA family pseudouridine synthase [Lachnospiraceae bacterium]